MVGDLSHGTVVVLKKKQVLVGLSRIPIQIYPVPQLNSLRYNTVVDHSDPDCPPNMEMTFERFEFSPLLILIHFEYAVISDCLRQQGILTKSSMCGQDIHVDLLFLSH